MKQWKRIVATITVAVAAVGVVAAFAIPAQYHGEWCAVPRENERNGEYTWGLCSRFPPDAAAQAVKLNITENSVKIGGTAAPWVYEITNEGPRTRGPDDYWQLDMRGEKEILTFALYRTNAKLGRNDGRVEEVPVLITENSASEKEHGPIPVLFGLDWLDRQATETLRRDAEAKRTYPGLQGEELEKKKRDMEVNRAMEDALFSKDAPMLRGRADELRDRVMRGY